ncbi:low molecular weight protein-tyrosine-phosphatase [Companilactobacillus kimchiensis]|nr:low molecular weight protein-tyrosine-phosphatase [Companilactobacillus kimchiensis]
MKKIIFVCLGNICRSPMAEMIMDELISQQGLSDALKVESRATSTYEIGNTPHSGAIEELKRHKVPVIEHRAKQITTSDFKNADLVIGMDKQNIIDLKQLAPIKDQSKIHLAFESLDKDSEIQDPWYDHKFDRTYQQLMLVLPAWLKKLE